MILRKIKVKKLKICNYYNNFSIVNFILYENLFNNRQILTSFIFIILNIYNQIVNKTFYYLNK